MTTKVRKKKVCFGDSLQTCLYTEKWTADGSYDFALGTFDMQIQSHPCRDSVTGKKKGESKHFGPFIVDNKLGTTYPSVAEWIMAQKEDPLLELIESLIERTETSALEPPWTSIADESVNLTPDDKKMLKRKGLLVYDDDFFLGETATDLSTLKCIHWPTLLIQPIDLKYYGATATVVCFWSTFHQCNRAGNVVLHAMAEIARKYERFGVRVVVVVRDERPNKLEEYASKAVKQKKERAFYASLNIYGDPKKQKPALCADVPMYYDVDQVVRNGFQRATGLPSICADDAFIINNGGVFVWRCRYNVFGIDPTNVFVKQLEYLLSNYTISNVVKSGRCELVNGSSSANNENHKLENNESEESDDDEEEEELPEGVIGEDDY
jgi:hypothetical protein